MGLTYIYMAFCWICLFLHNIHAQGGGGGVLELYMTGGGGGGGSDGASHSKPKKIHKPEILDPKKYQASKFPTQKKYQT